ncbi:Crp/Fnr family transcriptional regulator [Pseudothauera rhizosphaerae]|uniref:Crp/Fnr family transcriptional regulator n=1 Tax=Pseudothauera rhizosphaerae TaxID=2565932 RepID=A0A4S4AVS8_9RHOO|nr:Crp/Fnr family transcriptional regulator [Pseudothauera rhizosphaerae]THF64130.1 Crp/Fnr family transcriptional regulator [Pseudothauera rhizosphaerae]
MDTSALIRKLAESSIFSKVDEQALQALLADATLVRLKARQHLFHMGEKAMYFFLVKSGSITLYRPSYTGDHKIFRSMEEGDLLAETAMFAAPCHYPLSAQAATNADVYRLSRERLLQLCRQSPDFSMAMLEGMAVRITQSLNRIDLLTIGNAAQRLVTYLMDIYMQQRSAWLILPASQSVLARQLNIVPETLSRQLGGFRRAGLIGGHNRELVLLDVDGLCKAVDLPPPDANFDRLEPTGHLGSSLFDCCNYAKQTLGRSN